MSENWELIGQNSELGFRTYLGTGDEPDTVLVRREFDPNYTRALIDQNKAEANEATGRMGDMVKVASIPACVMYEWLTKFGVNAWNPAHKDAVKRLLNSGDYRYLKTRNIII